MQPKFMAVLMVPLILLSVTACAQQPQSPLPTTPPTPPKTGFTITGLSTDDLAHIGLLLGREQSEAAATFNASQEITKKMQEQITAQLPKTTQPKETK